MERTGPVTYQGLRTPRGFEVYVLRNADGVRAVLPMRNDVVNHSPTGPAWGYNGRGPAQLALAILLHHFSDGVPDRALWLYQRFKDRVIARLSADDGWTLTTAQVQRALEYIDSPKPAPAETKKAAAEVCAAAARDQ